MPKEKKQSPGWSAYNYSKLSNAYVANELQQIIKDIEDLSVIDSELRHKYVAQAYSDDNKKRFQDAKIGQTDYSLLHLAAKKCRKLFCEFLITDFKIDINVKCKVKQTPLHHFINYNILSKKDCSTDETENNKQISFKILFQVFINQSANFNAQDENGCTALYYAASKNNYFAVVCLLAVPSIDINLHDKNGVNPLHLACKYGNVDIAILLIERTDASKLIGLIIADPTKGAALPLHLICENKGEKFLLFKTYIEKIKSEKQLDRCLKKENDSQQTILHISIENNHLNIVELLFRGFNMSKDLRDGLNGNLPIHSAAKNGSIEMFNLLHKYDAVSFRQNNHLENALHIAALHNKSKFINEFLKYEKFCNDHSENSKFVQCACKCEVDKKNYVPTIKARDLKQYTPLLTALAASNQKCVEELFDCELLETNATDNNGNSIYHICAQYDNAESLKYLYCKTDDYNDLSIYDVKNSNDDTILHLTSRNGNLEMTNFIVNKIYETKENADEILYAKNKYGQTCFHAAAGKGFFNLIEYFLKKKKLFQFLHQVDNDLNTGLHLATSNGHSSVVGLLLDSGADADAKNNDKLTALDLSCLKGFFDICKTLIEHSDLTNQDASNIKGDFPLHYACRDGAHELVRLLLTKGAKINQLNGQDQNCLDLAIKNGHREVARVLLDDPNWYKLIRVDKSKSYDIEEDENDFKLIVQTETIDTKMNHIKDTFVALYDNKMWDIFQLLLDKCKINESETNFTILDSPVKTISNHPLLLIARSGQENLIKHETTSLLLQLKWRYIPRFLFYFNLCLYFVYLSLFSFYTIEISNSQLTNETNSSNIFHSSSNDNLTDEYNDDLMNETISSLRLVLYRFRGFREFDISQTEKSTGSIEQKQVNKPESLFILLIVVIVIQILKEIIQLVFYDGFVYFLSFQNQIEIITYSISLASLFAADYSTQCSYGSMAVLFAYMLFPIFIQKIEMLGIYVVALQRTLVNSAKLFPIFIILFIGFLLSFRLRANFGVSYSSNESLSFSLFRTITMAVGELDTSKMGLYNNDYALPNYIIYFLFIVLMCTIVLNLFVGIAVGEIKTVLDEAEVQLQCIRIIFTIKIQSAIQPIRNNCKCFSSLLDMNHKKYSYEKEKSFIKLADKLLLKFLDFFQSTEEPINLLDPQKRLEDTFVDMTRLTIEQIRSVKTGFSGQINGIESKIINAQRRLQDSLNEFSGSTNQQLNQFQQESKSLSATLKTELATIEKLLNDSSSDISYTNKYFNTRLAQTEQNFLEQVMRLESILIDMTKRALFQFESVKETCITEPKSIKSLIIKSERLLEEFLADLVRSNYNNNLSMNGNATISGTVLQYDKPNNEEIKLLINKMFDKTIDELRSNENNFYSQRLQLETVATSLKSLLVASIVELKEKNNSELEALREDNANLGNKIDNIEMQLKEFKEAICNSTTNLKQ